MNQETIENFIKNLGQSDFDRVCKLLLEKVFDLQAIDVDGKGDGGSDYLIFIDTGMKKTTAIQKTVQGQDWELKAFEDARKAKTQLQSTRFFFLTSRAHQQNSFRRLESKIISELDMPATCFGATEIAGLITDNKLLGEFAHLIELPIDNNLRHRPDQREIMLHTYFSLSDDRHNLQQDTYEKALLSRIRYSKIPLTREALLEETSVSLGLDGVRRQSLDRRIDALLTKRKIQKRGDNLYLGQSTLEELKVADAIYYNELADLSSAQSNLIDKHGGKWDQSKSEEAALLLTQCFIEEQIKAAEKASLSFSMVGFKLSKDSFRDKLKVLIVEAGVPGPEVYSVLRKMVDLARDTALVKKLTSSVMFLALENPTQSKASVILGASSWTEIKIILDASVAIPYLTSSLFSPSPGRYSEGSNETIKIFKKHGARLLIPLVYLNECASHLVGAVEYCQDLNEFEESLQFLKNGYVAHYYQLKKANHNIPNTLEDYIKQISNSAIKRNTDKQYLVKNVERDLQPLFKSFDVELEHVPGLKDMETKEIEVDYAHELDRLKRKKPRNLIDNDVKIISYLKKRHAENLDKIICLTWDQVMISIGAKHQDNMWIVTPDDAADLFLSKLSLGEGKVLRLAHDIARTMDKPGELGARIIDKAVRFAGDKLTNWEFRSEIKKHIKQATDRFKQSNNDFDSDAFDRETDSFFREKGVDTSDDQAHSNG